MVTVSGYTTTRMKAIEDASVVSGLIVGDDLILTRYDESTINAGDVRGSQGIQGVPGEITEAELDVALALASPPGMVTMCAFPTIPSGWLALEGQSEANADTLYPNLWAVAPAAWKLGSSLTLPDMRGRVPTGQDGGSFNTLEGVGGSESRVLAKTNVPKHYHEMDHDHPSTNTDTHTHAHTTDDDTHSHNMTTDGNHDHNLGDGAQIVWVQANQSHGVIGSGDLKTGYATWDVEGNHVHAIYNDTHHHATDSDAHAHALNLPNFLGNTENGTEDGLGSAAFDIMQPYFVLRFIIKT